MNQTAEKIVPENQEHWLSLRTQDITSTEVSALFGANPHLTAFELWHRHKDGTQMDFVPNERILWGNRLQDAIARGIAEDEKWQIRAMNEYIRIPSIRMGSSFDYEIEGEGLLEIKNVDGLAYLKNWIEEDGNPVEAPPHIEFQVQHQLAITGKPYAYIGALVGGNRRVLMRRDPLPEVIEQIRQKITAFWASIDAGTPPPPEARDAEFLIKRIYNRVQEGTFVDLTMDADFTQLADLYQDTGDKIRQFEKDKEILKAHILAKIGQAEKAIGNGFTVSAGMVKESTVSFTRQPFRNFRVNWKQKK